MDHRFKVHQLPCTGFLLASNWLSHLAESSSFFKMRGDQRPETGFTGVPFEYTKAFENKYKEGQQVAFQGFTPSMVPC